MMHSNDLLYARTYQTSTRNNFRIEDLMGAGQELDFDRPFMPEALARTGELGFLSIDEQRVLNQIRGNTYLCLFGIVEEFILPFLLDHMRPRVNHSKAETRALLQFAAEEAKHIDLFRRFELQFKRGFQSECEVIGPASEIGKAVLAHHPLAVALAILMIEWMTQAHYLQSIRDNAELDGHFKNLLRNHWIEESQHAQLDQLIVEALAARCTPEARIKAFDEYLEIGAFLDAGLQAQLELEIQAFQRKTGRMLDERELAQTRAVLLASARYTFIGSGMVHPKFRAALAKLDPNLLERLDTVAPAFC